MEVLYCFKLGKETGELKTFEITDWVDRGDKIRYTLPDDANIYHLPKRNLDKFINGKYMTFKSNSGDIVAKTIERNLLEKLAKARTDANRYQRMLDRIGEAKREM